MSASRRKKAHHEEHENHERWLITYADMITLLMAFFVMMYGMSILDLKKFADFKDGAAKQLGRSPAITGGQGILLGGTGVAGAGAPALGTGPRDGAGEATQVTGEVNKDRLAELMNEISAKLAEHEVHDVELEIDPRGLIAYLPAQIVFGSGAAFMSVEGRQVLDRLAGVLAHIDNQVIVEGHTDDIPTRGGKGYATNWELSTARATQVLRWFTEVRQLPAVRFAAAGYADTRPRATNTTAEGRAMNRRVEIVIVASDATDGIETALQGA